jgi:hypothetical protein
MFDNQACAPFLRTQALDPFLIKGLPPELIAAVENAVSRVLVQHGLSAFAMPRAAAIAHEAAHAIVGAHEGLKIKRVTVFSCAMPPFRLIWGGFCGEAGRGRRVGSATSADGDLRRARFIIAGLAGEAITGLDKPGSSLDELALSQLISLHAAVNCGRLLARAGLGCRADHSAQRPRTISSARRTSSSQGKSARRKAARGFGSDSEDRA